MQQTRRPLRSVTFHETLDRGFTLCIQTARVKPWSVLNIHTGYGLQMTAIVILASSSEIKLLLDSGVVRLRPWQKGDEAAPQCPGDSVRWTVI